MIHDHEIQRIVTEDSIAKMRPKIARYYMAKMGIHKYIHRSRCLIIKEGNLATKAPQVKANPKGREKFIRYNRKKNGPGERGKVKDRTRTPREKAVL